MAGIHSTYRRTEGGGGRSTAEGSASGSRGTGHARGRHPRAGTGTAPQKQVQVEAMAALEGTTCGGGGGAQHKGAISALSVVESLDLVGEEGSTSVLEAGSAGREFLGRR